MRAVPPPAAAPSPTVRNAYGRMEWAGAFGDLGTLLPFVAAYIAVVGLDPFGILFAFGVSMVACGLHYRTPMPVQPMKAAGAIATLQAAQAVTPSVVHAAALATGAAWLLLGASGWLARIVRWIPPAVVIGIVLGLGLGFMLQSLQLMAQGWWLAAGAAAVAIALRRSRVLPAMFALLALGVAVGGWQQAELLQRLGDAPVGLRLPDFAPADIGWQALATGIVLLALPQLPLTLGNAIIAVRQENNRLFPQRPVAEGELAVSTGLMNLLAGCTGGVPMCHGAGGMAGHVAFGARTGGAVVIVGALLLLLALFFSAGVALLFALFALPVLGVMLFASGLHLVRGAALPRTWRGRAVVLACAATCLWNVLAGFAVGLLLHLLLAHGTARSGGDA